MFVRSCGLVLALCAWLAVPLGAQEAVNTASVSGRVTDPQGMVLPGALVIARHLDTNVTRETVTDDGGRFRLPYLRIGRYEIVVRLEGFADTTHTITLSAGAAFELPLRLSVVRVDADVTVSAEVGVLETARSQIAATISQGEVQDLPLNGRNFLDLALLAPGVSPANVASTQLFAETSAVPGGGLSVGSQRNMSNNFIVDGLSANDDAAALSGMPYSVDAVEQFQVVTSGGQAELGRALGGYVNVVTKSGTNRQRGDAYGYFRDDHLNAANALIGETLPMDQQQAGVNLGGPVRRDRTFFFGNVEHRNLDQTGLVTIDPLAATLINGRLATVGYAGPPVATDVYPNPVSSTNVLGKIDHQAGARDQVSVKYSLYTVSADNARGAGGLSAPSASSGLDNTDQALSVSNVWTVSPRTVNETRAQFTRGNLEALPTDPFGPNVAINGVATFGTLSSSPTSRVNSMVQIVDNLSHQAGAHALRAGIDLLFNDDTIVFPRSQRGAYSFSSLANFLAGVYNNAGFTQTFGETVVSQHNPNAGLYVQDEWKVRSNLTINAGIRYDLQFLETINTDGNNVGPRAGFAWSPGASRRTIVRGSAGLFYDRVPLRALANALLSAGNTTDVTNLRQVSISLSPAQAAAPVFPAILSSAVPSVTLPNLTTMDPNMKNAYSRQASLEFEQQLGARTTVSAGYQYLDGRNLIISINQNVPSCVASGTNNGCRPNPSYGNNSQYSPRAESNYNALLVSFLQRPVRWGHYRVSYTLSKARSNVGEFFFSSPIDPFDLSKDMGRADNDQRHRLVINGAVEVATIQVSGTMQRYSALPLNITSGVNTVQGTAGRPVANGAFIPRNAGVGPDYFNVNLRVSRTFRLNERVRVQALAEAFNVTNHVNVVVVNGNFGAGAYPANPSPNFGRPIAVGDPRTMQLGARVSW